MDTCHTRGGGGNRSLPAQKHTVWGHFSWIQTRSHTSRRTSQREETESNEMLQLMPLALVKAACSLQGACSVATCCFASQGCRPSPESVLCSFTAHQTTQRLEKRRGCLHLGGVHKGNNMFSVTLCSGWIGLYTRERIVQNEKKNEKTKVQPSWQTSRFNP